MTADLEMLAIQDAVDRAIGPDLWSKFCEAVMQPTVKAWWLERMGEGNHSALITNAQAAELSERIRQRIDRICAIAEADPPAPQKWQGKF